MIAAEIKQGWKVTCKSMEGKYYSATNEAHQICYRDKKWTDRPNNCGPMGVFKDRVRAYLFASIMARPRSNKVFPCDYVESSDGYFWRAEIYDGVVKKIEEHTVPFGTVFADRVKVYLTREEVSNNENRELKA